MLMANMGRRSEYGLVKYIPARFLTLRCLVGCQDRYSSDACHSLIARCTAHKICGDQT